MRGSLGVHAERCSPQAVARSGCRTGRNADAMAIRASPRREPRFAVLPPGPARCVFPFGWLGPGHAAVVPTAACPRLPSWPQCLAPVTGGSGVELLHGQRLQRLRCSLPDARLLDGGEGRAAQRRPLRQPLEQQQAEAPTGHAPFP
jgi:hypothetical protein